MKLSKKSQAWIKIISLHAITLQIFNKFDVSSILPPYPGLKSLNRKQERFMLYNRRGCYLSRLLRELLRNTLQGKVEPLKLGERMISKCNLLSSLN